MRRKLTAGFTLVELMIVVAIIGILAAVAIPSFSRYVKKSRTVEAVSHAEKLWSASVAYYESDQADSATTVLPKQFPGSCGVSHEWCCGMPNDMCQGNNPVYNFEPWDDLSFNISQPHWYFPVYMACFTNQDAWIRVWGDLDCDNTRAEFTLKGRVINNTPTRYGPINTINELE